MRRLILVAILGLIPSIAIAQNATTAGTVTLASTLNCISVTAAFTGDANANNSVTVQFQKHTGDTGFHNAYTAYIDRRGALGGKANPYVDQARLGIVGLVENTSYDVKVTWADGDGVSGTNPITMTVSTLSSTPPTGGTTRNITDNASMTTALGAMNPGDTLLWSAGSYSAFTISRSGNSGAWIVLDGGGVATINGSGVNQNIQLSADFVVLKNFILSPSDFHGINIGGQNNVIVSGNTILGFSTLCANGPSTSHAEDAGINIGNNASNIMVLNNRITGSPNIAARCLQSSNFNGPGGGIMFPNSGICTTCIVGGNTLVGNGMRDCITSDNSNGSLRNTTSITTIAVAT